MPPHLCESIPKKGIGFLTVLLAHFYLKSGAEIFAFMYEVRHDRVNGSAVPLLLLAHTTDTNQL